jgi:hypothetical protein
MTFSLINTVTRENSANSWGTSGFKDQGFFTDDEYKNIVEPYWNWLESQPGFISYEVTFPDELTKISTLTCETQNNITDIVDVTLNGGLKEQNPLFKDLHNLVLSKSRNKLITKHLKVIDNSTNTVISDNSVAK